MIALHRLAIESWPLAGEFHISRGAKTTADVVTVELTNGVAVGRGECTPYPRYGETVATVRQAIARAVSRLPASPPAARRALASHLPAGAARNAIDCALWDLEAKRHGRPVWQVAGLPRPTHALTCYTLSLDTPDAMARAAVVHAHLPLLKLKLGAPGDADRMRAVRAARSDARLVVDANEGWDPEVLPALVAVAHEVGIELIEQPLPAHSDEMLRGFASPIPICADEAAEPGARIPDLCDRYTAVNVKLDKAGGLSGALRQISEARRCGLDVMLGSMVGTSLAMAPAMLLSSRVRWVDLDSPLLLARDRPAGLRISDGWIAPPTRRLWG